MMMKSRVHSYISTSLVLLLVSLLCFSVFPFSSSEAGDGVDSNTITSGTATSSSTGTATDVVVSNEDGSQTTTTTTPVTTTTTTTTVAQTAISNVNLNPSFTGGTSTNWTLVACGGNGCAFDTNVGFKTSYGLGKITQALDSDDLLDADISSIEAGQGMTFSFGADVDNRRNNSYGTGTFSGQRPDTWTIKMEIFNSGGSSLGATTMTDNEAVQQVQTGTLHIAAGNVIDNALITMSGVDAGYWAGWYGPRFDDVFTTYLYNEISTEISESITYTELMATVSCEILDTCVDDVVDDIIANTVDVEEEFQDDPLAEPSMDVDGTDTVEPSDMGDDMEMVEVDLAPPPEIEPPTMDAPEPEISSEAEAEVEVEIEAEINNEMEATAPAEEVEVEVEVAETTEADTDTDEGEDESAEVKQKQKQKAANKIVKKMGDKGRYDGGNQLKTLVVMNVLGDSKRFFATTVVLKDAQARKLFTLARIPDAVISDNNYNQYFMFGGSSMAHDALVDSQYKG
jgi:hypothetical protein